MIETLNVMKNNSETLDIKIKSFTVNGYQASLQHLETICKVTKNNAMFPINSRNLKLAKCIASKLYLKKTN